MGRLNPENAMVVPGGWDDIAVITGDDTFSAPSSQLYLYLAGSTNDLWEDRGRLWAFRVTRTEAGKVDPADAFNGANDGDIASGDRWQGRFIKVPRAIALGNTAKPPQTALEDWSNEHNVFQFIRVEDTAYDPGHRGPCSSPIPGAAAPCPAPRPDGSRAAAAARSSTDASSR
ncbi:MAG: hypothetical protein ABWZ53_00250 [Actinomycetota bacterium]